jgi:hypothetical protein
MFCTQVETIRSAISENDGQAKGAYLPNYTLLSTLSVDGVSQDKALLEALAGRYLLLFFPTFFPTFFSSSSLNLLSSRSWQIYFLAMFFTMLILIRPLDHEFTVVNEEIPTVRLDSFVKERGIKVIDILKIDVEKSELAVLRSAGDALAHTR